MDAETPVMTGEWRMSSLGHMVPWEKVRPQTKLEDQTVTMLCSQAKNLQKVMSNFRTAAFDDIDQFMLILAEKYGARGRSTTNTVLNSFDGLLKVEVSTGHFLNLGPELEAAKSLIDECLTEWSNGANANLQAIVADAFAVGEGGKLRVDRVLALRRVDIDDPKWKEAMRAISDALQVTRSKRYIRFHQRETLEAPWVQITLDVARVP